MAKIYSHSRLSTFEQCPFKFKLRYIDKIIPEVEKSIEAHLGSAVHDTLEWLYNTIKQTKEIPGIEKVIEVYSEKWIESFTEDIQIVRKNLTSKDYFNKGVSFLVDYYTKNHPFDDGTIECEKKILLNLHQDKPYKLQGFIDRLVKNPHTGKFEIHDYKTANTLPPREKIETDRQLALYSIAIKELYNTDEDITLVWHYLAHNMKITSNRTKEQLEQLKKETLELIEKIEKCENFPTKKSILCDWCEYKTMCPEFGGIINEGQNKLNAFSKNSESNLNEKIESKEKPNGLDIW